MTNRRKRVFLDTEFTGLRQDTTLVSIGLVADTGEGYYAELSDFDWMQVDTWIEKNVIQNLIYPESHRLGSYEVSEGLREWFSEFDEVEIWSDCLSYDWVLFCELFGGAFGIPSNIYYIPFDLSTAFALKGIDPDVNREEFLGIDGKKHNAFHDAHVIKLCVEALGI